MPCPVLSQVSASPSTSIPGSLRAPLFKPCVFRFRLLQNPRVRVGIPPDREEIPIRADCARPIAGHCQRTPQFEPRQRAHRIGERKRRMIDNLPELNGGIGAAVHLQIRFAAHIDRLETSEVGEVFDR